MSSHWLPLPSPKPVGPVSMGYSLSALSAVAHIFLRNKRGGERESRSEFLLHSCKQRARCICFTPSPPPSPSPASTLSGCTLKGINSVLKRISLVSCCQIRCAPLPFSVWADLRARGCNVFTALIYMPLICVSSLCLFYTSVISFTPTQLMVLWHSRLCFL